MCICVRGFESFTSAGFFFFGLPHKKWHNFFLPKMVSGAFFVGYSLTNSPSNGMKHVFLWILSMLALNSTRLYWYHAKIIIESIHVFIDIEIPCKKVFLALVFSIKIILRFHLYLDHYQVPCTLLWEKCFQNDRWIRQSIEILYHHSSCLNHRETYTEVSPVQT